MGRLKLHPRLRLVLFGAMPLSLLLLYAIWYWTNDHAALAAWYKSINPYFYNATTWETDLFTPSVKYMGNWWCLAALTAASILAYINWKKPNITGCKDSVLRPFWKIIKSPKHQLTLAFSAISIIGSFISLLSNHSNIYATDEVFSAVNFADLPIFQTLSDYPLPNNHILFNTINQLLFFWSGDKVLTGRILSLLFYLITLCCTWLFLDKWRISHWLKSAITMLLALQFPVCGFSFQARGYELVLLCSCLSLFSFLGYFTDRKPYYLTMHASANVAGMMALPTYLYWWLGLFLAACILQIIDRKIEWAFIKASFSGFAWSLVLVLPMLCFSGIGALTDNRYVQGDDMFVWQFLANINEQHYFNGLFAEWFGAGNWSILIAIFFMVMPIMLFIYPKNNPNRRNVGIAFYSILIAFILMAAQMAKLPFYRNLIAQGYLVLLVPLIAIAPLFKKQFWKVIFTGSIFCISIGFAFNNHYFIPQNLYYYDMIGTFNDFKNKELKLNIDEPIYLDYEGFYWWYALQEKYSGHQIKILSNRPKLLHQADKLNFPLPSDSTIYQVINE